MGKFIEEFYYGNLDPQARSTKENKTVQKQFMLIIFWIVDIIKNVNSDFRRLLRQSGYLLQT